MRSAIENQFFNAKKKIEYFFYPERNRMSKQSKLNRRVAKMIDDFFIWDKENISTGLPSNYIQMTKITVKEKKSEINITVELCRPGLLIGKAGRTIDAITKRLTDHFGKKVNIHIEESWLF